MIQVRKAADRGHADHGWLNSYHTFSFAGYQDPQHMGFRNLRVINEDRVAQAQGFGKHSHQNMEIISYVLEGELEHKDSLGTGSIIRPGEVQVMSAGEGVTHSEFNHSQRDLVHFLQIWILPDEQNVRPNYAQKAFPMAERHGKLRLVASPGGEEGSLKIHADARLYATVLKEGESLDHAIQLGRNAWVQVARGAIRLNDTELSTSDGAAVAGEQRLRLTATSDAEVLVFDLA